MLGVWGPRRVPVPTRESPLGPALPPAHHGALDPGSTWSLMSGTSCLYFEQLYRTELRIRPLLWSTPGAARAPRHCWNATRASAGRRVRPWGDVSSREPNAGSGPASGSLRRLLRFKALKRSPALKAPTARRHLCPIVSAADQAEERAEPESRSRDARAATRSRPAWSTIGTRNLKNTREVSQRLAGAPVTSALLQTSGKGTS